MQVHTFDQLRRIPLVLVQHARRELAARETLEQHAARVFPDHLDYAERNRAEWIRAVGVVRGTSRGWLFERNTPRLEKPL